MKTSVVVGIVAGVIASAVLSAYLLVDTTGGSAEPERFVSQAQQEIVRDGDVSDEEYRQAAQAMVECLRAEGLAVSDAQAGPQGTYTYRYLDGAESLDDVESRTDVVQSCYLQHLAEVDRVEQFSPAHIESAESLGWAIQRCVEGRKSDFQFSDDGETLIRQIAGLQASGDADFQSCWEQVVIPLFKGRTGPAGSVDISFAPLPR